MSTEFRLPELGENITQGDIVSVLVQEGETVAADQAVFEIETDKATVELPCPLAGKITKIHVAKGQTVEVGAVLLTIDAVGAAAATPAAEKPAPAKAAADSKRAPKSEAPRQPKPEAGKPAAAPAAAPSPAPVAQAAPVANGAPAVEVEDPEPEPLGVGSPAAAGPATRRLARELGVDLQRIHGSGPGGRIVREDIIAEVRRLNASAGQAADGATLAEPRPSLPGVEDRDAFGRVHRDKLSRMRKTIAANMARSHSTIPHVTNFDDADITELERIRKESAADYVEAHVKLTMMSFVTKAVALALRQHPLVNASLDLERDEILYKDYVNVGVAVDTERGLLVPVLRGVDRMSIPQIAQALGAVAAKARAGQQTLDDLRGGTFTISNLGAVGGVYSTPIINHPEVAILLLGRSRKLPIVAEHDQVQVRLMMPLSLSYDHRLIDGATAARFLNEVIGYLQTPGRLLLAP